jgi:hypothetical protein
LELAYLVFLRQAAASRCKSKTIKNLKKKIDQILLELCLSTV